MLYRKAIRSPCQTTPPLLHVWHRWWLFYYIWIMSLNLGMDFLMMGNTRHEWCFLLCNMCIFGNLRIYVYLHIESSIRGYIMWDLETQRLHWIVRCCISRGTCHIKDLFFLWTTNMLQAGFLKAEQCPLVTIGGLPNWIFWTLNIWAKKA